MLLSLVLLGVVFLLPGTTTARAPITAVSVFRRDEVDLHKYAAVLAAIEPFRNQLKEEIRRSLNPFGYVFQKIKGTNLEDPGNGLRGDNKDMDVAYGRYEARINDIVRAYAINVQAFNDLSRKISRDSSLKRKILRQAYNYRIAADLETLTRASLPTLPVPAANREEQQPPSYDADSPSELTRFCRALRTIEGERLKIRETLQHDLGVKFLPPRMCDPELRPLMCRQVQNACQMYPTVASRVTEYHGLAASRFDELYAQTDRNPLFRFQVTRELKRLEREFAAANNK